MIDQELLNRLKSDVEAIHKPNDRTAAKAELPLRWEGFENNPLGWRTLGNIADDIQALLGQLNVS